MRILHILPHTADNKGGLAFSAGEIIAAEAKQKNHQIDVAVVKTEDEHIRSCSAETLSQITTLHRLNDASSQSNQLKRLCIQSPPDLVVFWLPEITPKIIDFLKGLDVPLVVRASTTYDLKDMSQQNQQSYRQCFSLVKSKNGHVICNSEANKEWNHRHFGVPNDLQTIVLAGVETKKLHDNHTPLNRETLNIADNAYVVSNVSRLTSSNSGNGYRKDPFGFILMASALSKTHPDMVFILCGNGATWSNSFVRIMINRANRITGGNLRQENFKALGHVAHTEDIYQMSDAHVSTAQSESFGRTIVEAMQYGVPSVVTDTGVMPEMNGKVSHVIPVREFSYEHESGYYGDDEKNCQWAKKASTAIQALQERSPEQVHDDAEYLKTRASEEYSTERVARSYSDLYKEIVDKNCSIKPKGRPKLASSKSSHSL